MKVQGKGVVITGGASGIGKELTIKLLELGAFVVIADISDGTEFKNQLKELFPTSEGHKYVFTRCDVTNFSDIEKAIVLCEQTFGTFDVMCNNAGVQEKEDFVNGAEFSWVLCSKINFDAVLAGTQLAINHMKKNPKGGVIINTASIGGIVAMPIAPVYGAAKSGVIHFTRSLAHLKDLYNIRVCCVCPSFTDTPLIKKDNKNELRELSGGLLTVEQVALGFLALIDDDTQAGSTLRVTFIRGYDFYEPKRVAGVIISPPSMEQLKSKL